MGRFTGSTKESDMNDQAGKVGATDAEAVQTIFGKFGADDIMSIKLVVLGGFLGGLLQPAVARLDPSQVNPTWPNWLIGPVLGIAAAGITVFVLANSNTENKLRLLFFSLLCGLAFPAVLTSAVEGVNAQSKDVTERAEKIATKAVAGNADAAAADLTKAMLDNPTSTDIDRSAEAHLESSAETVVSKLADKAEAGTGASADKAIEQLKQIGTAARSAGYDGTAIRVTEELKKIEANADTGAMQKETAGEAADDIIGIGLMSTPGR
jgi:fluoride ion exporter CrcB/FEX